MQKIESTLIHKIAPLPAAAPGPLPTLILLHGRGANEDDLLGLTPYLDPRFMVVAVRAPFPFAYGGAAWYEMQSIGSPHAEQFSDSYQRLVRFISDCKRHYPVDPARLFLLGFSQGTVVAYAYALTHPEQVNGVVAHSGYIPEGTGLFFEWNKLKGKGFFVAHGTEDPLIGIEFSRRARELLAGTDAELTYREYPIAHTISEESISEVSGWLRNRIDGKAHDHGD